MENFPSEISEKTLLHYKLQSIIRDNNIPSDQLLYLGERDDNHWYLIAGIHEVTVDEIEGIEEVDNEDTTRV